MCNECGAIICAIFDLMIIRELAYLAATSRLTETNRPVYYSLDVGKSSRQDNDKLSELVAQVGDLGMSPEEFETELVNRTQMSEPVKGWINDTFVPNGMARKIILVNVESIIREHGAKPKRSASELRLAA